VLQAAVDSAEQSDIVIAVVGEAPYAERVGNIHDIYLPVAQQELLTALIATGKPVVVVLVEGRPRVLNNSTQGAAAVLQAYLPCLEGGQAIAEVLFGVVNPSGRLPYTYPEFVSSVPIQYWHVYSQVTDSPDGVTVQWPFGYGLSYSTFEYSDLQLSSPVENCQNSTTPQEVMTVSVSVKNSGSVAGRETVLLFLQDQFRSVTPEVQLLKGFDKVELQPGESAQVTFSLGCEDFAFYGVDQYTLTIESGNWTASVVGSGSQNTLSADFSLLVDVPRFEPTYWDRRK